MLSPLCHLILRLFGWKVIARLPEPRRMLIIGAFHTSNWDFPLALLALSAMGLNYHWGAKDSLFFWPLGPIFRKLGGIPVNRQKRHEFMNQVTDLFARDEVEVALAVAPEGTRAYTDHWKAGFYHMAMQAGVPVALGFVDYRRKEVGIGGSFLPSGNPQEDLIILQNFYTDKTGRYPEKQSAIRFRDKELAVIARLLQRKQ